jgi:predicted transcriptional regulator
MRKKMDSGELLRLVICSDLRKNLLISLNEDKKSLGDLRNELNISSTTAIHALRELEKSNLTFQDKDKNYVLTKIGRILTMKVADFSNAVDVLKKYERFWLEHDLTGIPEHMIEKIGWLMDSTLLEAPNTDIFKVYSTFIELLKNAKEIRGVSSIFVPDYTTLFKDIILTKKIDTKLVLTEEVLEKIDKNILKEISDDKSVKLELYISKKELKIGFMVTNLAFSLGLFDSNGIYDWNRDLISDDQKAIAWGYELFEYYTGNSERIDL